MAQGINGIQIGCLVRWIEPKENTDRCCSDKRQQDGFRDDFRAHIGKPFKQC